MMPERAQPLGVAINRVDVRGHIGRDVAVLAGALVVFALLALRLAPFVPDDSFITYRYAANLAGGAGLRFNPGDAPLEGYSNFLWIVLLAAAAGLDFDLVAAGALLGGLFGGLGVVVLWALLRRRGLSGWHLAVPVGLLAAAGPLLLYAVSGMETTLFACLLLLLLLVAERLLARPAAAWGLALGGAGSLAALTRPEGVLALPVVAICLAVFEWRSAPERRRAVWRALAVATLIFAATQGAYHLWRVTYFDAFWPTPFIAKGASDGATIDMWLANFTQFFTRQTHYYLPLGYYYAAIALPAAVGALWAGRRGERRPVEWTALVLALILAAVYLNFVDWMPGMRYYAPLIGLLLIPLAALGPAWRNPDERDGRGPGDAPYLMLGATLALFSLAMLAGLRLDSSRLQASTEASLIALGHWLADTMPPDTVLAMSDVGATPYYSGLHTVDINPASLTDRMIAAEGWSADYFFAVDPDVVILTAFSLIEPAFYGDHRALYDQSRFQSTYARIGVVRNDWYQDRSYWVFVRRDRVPNAAQMAGFPAGIDKP